MKELLFRNWYLVVASIHALVIWGYLAKDTPAELSTWIFWFAIMGLALVIWWSARRTFKAEDHVRAINARGPLRAEDQDEAKYAVTEFPKATHALALNFTLSALTSFVLFCTYPAEWGFLIWSFTFALGSREHWSLYKELINHERA